MNDFKTVRELVEEAQRVLREARMTLEMLAVDYMIARDGTKHLLEVNHIPNVTVFPEIREAYLDWAANWVSMPPNADKKNG